jgi:hypothetical protein
MNEGWPYAENSKLTVMVCKIQKNKIEGICRGREPGAEGCDGAGGIACSGSGGRLLFEHRHDAAWPDEEKDAYRRDRGKDMLLQEHGYLVLRFLAEDVGKQLDAILDATLRAVSPQRAFGNDLSDAQRQF